MSRRAAPLALLLAAILHLLRGAGEALYTLGLFKISASGLPPARMGEWLADWCTRPLSIVSVAALAGCLYFPILFLSRLRHDRSRLPRKNLSAGDMNHEA